MNGDQLKAFREMVGLSQQDMADQLGYGRRNYQLMETGETPVRNSVALACAAFALGIREYDGPAIKAQLLRRKQKGKTDRKGRNV